MSKHSTATPINGSLVCLSFTLMGRLLVQHEVNTTLSIQFPQLALLLASLVQFGNGASISCSTGFARVELNREDGLSVTVSTDTIANVATAVVTRLQPDVNSCDYDVLEFARLQSLVILKALVTMNAHAVEQAVEANRAIIEKQAEEYTLSNALNHRMIDEQGGTLEEFVTFQRDVVDRVMMISPNQTISISNKDNLAAITSASIINAENGHNVYHSIPSPHDLPRIVSALTQRAASALHRAYPLLVQTLRFQRHTGSSNIEFVNRHSSLLTIVLQFPTNTSEDQTLVAIRMLSVRRIWIFILSLTIVFVLVRCVCFCYLVSGSKFTFYYWL